MNDLNPSLEKLLNDNNVLITTTKQETRTILKEDGTTYVEIADVTGIKDVRQFVKTYATGIDTFLKLLEGNPIGQTPFILMAMLINNINRDYVHLTAKDINRVLEDRAVKQWTRGQASKSIKWLLDNNVITKVEGKKDKYWINLELVYNGMIHRNSRIEELM